MTPVTIYTPLPPTVSMQDVSALLGAAGLTAASEIQWIAQCAGGDGVRVLFVVISDGPAAANALEEAVRATVTMGARVIAVWPQGQTGGLLPTVLQDYGAGLVSWNPSAVHSAICNQGEEWQDAGGGVRTAPPIDRNKNC